MKPARLLDGMDYTPSHKTDIRRLFARIRKEQREAAERAKQTLPVPITRKKA